MDVWAALEQAKASLDAKIANLERARDRIPYEGARAINLANIYTYMMDVLERVRSVVECLSNAKDSNAVTGGKQLLRVKGMNWYAEVSGNALVLKRINPAVSITITPEEVKIAIKSKDEKEIKREVVLSNNEFKMKRDKMEVSGKYNDYENVLNNAYYIRRAFKEVAREVMKKSEPLITHMKFMNVTC